MPELEKRKKELADKRSIFKPMDMSEINLHSKKYEAMMEEGKQKAHEKRMQKYKEIGAIPERTMSPSYRSHFHSDFN